MGRIGVTTTDHVGATPQFLPGGGSSGDDAPGRPRNARRLRLPVWVAVLVPGLVAVVLCAFDLSGRSIWIDESATISIASQHGAALWAGMRRDGGNMMAYYALVHVLFSWFGDSTSVLRAPSVAAAGIDAAVVAAIGSRLFRPRVGLAAGLVSAVSIAYVYWGQNGRAYELMFACGSLAYLAFVHLVDGESSRRPGRPPRFAPVLYVASLVAGVYMSFVVVLLVPAQLLSLYWYRRRYRLVGACLVLVALCAVPVLVLAHARGSSQLFWVPRPGPQSELQVLQAIAGSGLPPVFHLTASNLPLLALTVLAAAATAVAGCLRARSHPLEHGISRGRWAGALVAAWLVVPTLLDLLESFVGQSVFQSRYLLMSAPALALLLAWGLFETRLPEAAGWTCLGGLLVLRGAQILPTYGASPENWRAATGYVLARERPGDCVLFYPSDARQAFDYYVRRSHVPATRWPRPLLPALPFAEVRPYVEDYATLGAAALGRDARTCPRMWLVSSHAGVPNGTPVSVLHYRRYRALVREIKALYPVHRLVRVSYASQIDIWLFRGNG